ncbi:MAG TPA: kynureninase [Candidatus Dormibacteraeota bacterium]|nr:kynureninase [Candidatus Dormibacteraeota bacterium]
MDRRDAERLDAGDPLAWLRDRFVVDEAGPLYLDGNSLGRLPRATVGAVEHVLREEWGSGLVRSWLGWMERAEAIGDVLGSTLLGAAAGQVAVSDSTSVNLYKLTAAALDARPERGAIVSSADNFPTDRYVLEGLAAARGLSLRLLSPAGDRGIGRAAVEGALGPDVALVSLSHTSYLSAAVEDVAAITAAAHRAGALVLWDLCHSVGALPVELDAWGVDLAVGCTYKYVNAGPGAPAFLYVRRELQERLRQPIWGWFGQREQFRMGPAYDPAPGIGHFLVGTPPMLSLTPVGVGVELLGEAGIDRLRARSVALTELVIALWDGWLRPLGFTLASPRDSGRRGGHVALAHPEGYRISQALIAAGVVPDFRPPDLVRLCPAPAYTRFVEVWDAMARLRDLVAGGAHLALDARPGRVT